MARMLEKLIRRIGTRHHCRNTRLEIFTEARPGHEPQVIIAMIDKCTGASWEAAYGLDTAARIVANLEAKMAFISDKDA